MRMWLHDVRSEEDLSVRHGQPAHTETTTVHAAAGTIHIIYQSTCHLVKGTMHCSLLLVCSRWKHGRRRGGVSREEHCNTIRHSHPAHTETTAAHAAAGTIHISYQSTCHLVKGTAHCSLLLVCSRWKHRDLPFYTK